MSSTKMSLLVIVFLTCNVALFVHGQVNAELDRPFVTREGAVYRDELTIASSKSVAQFAKSYQRRENGKATHNRRHNKVNGKGLQTPTFTTFGQGYDPNSHAAAFDKRFPIIDFTTSRRLHYLTKHKKERVKADQDEFELVSEAKRKERPAPQPSSRLQNRPSSTRSRPAPRRPAPRRQPAAPRRQPAARQRSRIPAQRPLPSASQRARTQVSTSRRTRPQYSIPAKTQPSVPARSRGLPRQRQPINRFEPVGFTTPRPQIQQLFNAQHAANIAQSSAPVITSRIIIPAAEYYQTISPNYQYDSGYPLGAAPIQQPVTSVPALPYSDYSAADQYGSNLYGSPAVNYGFTIDHI